MYTASRNPITGQGRDNHLYLYQQRFLSFHLITAFRFCIFLFSMRYMWESQFSGIDCRNRYSPKCYFSSKSPNGFMTCSEIWVSRVVIYTYILSNCLSSGLCLISFALHVHATEKFSSYTLVSCVQVTLEFFAEVVRQ